MPNVKVIIDCNYGDSGKGLMTDYFAAKAKENGDSCLVVCTNGSCQRGHTVETPEGVRHIFHHFGSGTFAGADTYFPEYFIINPMEFRREFCELKTVNNVYVNKHCKIATPYDMIANQIIEEGRGENRHGSCGMGVWETELRYKNGDWGLYDFYEFWSMFLTTNTIGNELKRIKKYHEKKFSEMNISIPEKWKNIWHNRNLMDNFIYDIKFFITHVKIVPSSYFICKYHTVIFENAQGLCLDQDYGEEKYTTPSKTGLTNPKREIIKYLPNADIEVCYITRTYLTRHGNGPLRNECHKHNINNVIQDRTNVTNEFQGSLRYAYFDNKEIIDMITRIDNDFSIAESGWRKSIAITHINEYPWKFNWIYDVFDNIYKSDGLTRESIEEINNGNV